MDVSDNPEFWADEIFYLRLEDPIDLNRNLKSFDQFAHSDFAKYISYLLLSTTHSHCVQFTTNEITVFATNLL